MNPSPTSDYRWMIVVAIVLILGTVVATIAAPLSLQEARDKVAADPEYAARVLVLASAILEEKPLVEIPESAAVVTGNDVTVTLLGPIIVHRADDRPRYEIILEPLTFRSVVPSPLLPDWAWALIAVGAAVGGYFLGHGP